MPLIFEDSEKIINKKIAIPQNAKKVFKAMKSIYKPYLDKNIPGSKILKSLGNDKQYNKKGKNSYLNGNDNKQDYVTVDDAKIRLHRMNKLPKNSIEYQLNGGELAANIYKRGIERARGVKKVDAVQPPKPTSNADLNPPKIKTKNIRAPSGTITYNVSENKIINESNGSEKFYDYMEDYDARYVFNSFLENPKGHQNWGPLINGDMYKKALSEFVRYGKLVSFPTKYVYQWIGIIFKNTCILTSNTSIVGHTSSLPLDEFEDFVRAYFNNDGRRIYLNFDNGYLKIPLTYYELLKIYNGKSLINENAQDSVGQTYFPFISQDDVNKININNKFHIPENMYDEVENIIDELEDIYLDRDNGIIYWDTTYYLFLDYVGLTDWMTMPDGSDAWSDFGLEPLYKILSEYDDDLEAEKVLVLVNKALDITHQRGDLSSIFIQGGKNVLDKISEGKRNPKKIYLKEKQIVKNGKYFR